MNRKVHDELIMRNKSFHKEGFLAHEECTLAAGVFSAHGQLYHL
jgi:hypothetical protein